MLPTALIVFREILEAALVVSIVMAATKGIPRREVWVGYGVIGGVVGAAAVAAFAGAIAQAAAGMGQEIFNATVMFLAVAMLGWHSIWMGRHGRELGRDLGAVGRAVSAGARPMYALTVVVGIAVLREGSEIVLFLYGIAAGSPGQAGSMVIGGGLGVFGGVGVGLAMYYGLLRVSMKHLFTVTTWLIILLAAGMASQGADFLVQADLLPPLDDAVWNTSGILTDSSILGKTLHTLIGYTAQPNGTQLIFYAATLTVIGLLTWSYSRSSARALPAGQKPSLSGRRA
jgi:high-affinity iron transporter